MPIRIRSQLQCHVNAVKQESSDEDSSDDGDFLAPRKKVQKQGTGATAGTKSKPKLASSEGSKVSSAVAASAQPARARPASGSIRPSSVEGSKAAGPSRPASGGANKSGASRPGSSGSGKAAGENPAAKPSRPLVASTTKVCSKKHSFHLHFVCCMNLLCLCPCCAGCGACSILAMLPQCLQRNAELSICHLLGGVANAGQGFCRWGLGPNIRF